ncbi:MAG: SHOCT domain-containing protein [Acidobacteriota bacterium]
MDGDIATATRLSGDAVKAVGGTVASGIPGETLRFSIKRPGIWRDSKNTPFDGTAKISAVNPAQSRIDLETSLAGIFYLYIGGSFVALVILTAISPYIGAVPLAIGLLACIYILVMAQGSWAQEMADRVAAGLTPSSHVAPQIPPSQPPPSAAAPPVAAAPSNRVMEDVKKLGELHASGVLTGAEFETKKAELLKRV